jgi:hypothetical protein
MLRYATVAALGATALVAGFAPPAQAASATTPPTVTDEGLLNPDRAPGRPAAIIGFGVAAVAGGSVPAVTAS